jgi:hypothetical protein
VTGQWLVAADGGGGGKLVAADLLVFMRTLIFLTADFGCQLPKKKWWHATFEYWTQSIGKGGGTQILLS